MLCYLRRLVSVCYIIIINVVVVKEVPVVLQLFVADNFGHVCTFPTKRLDKISGRTFEKIIVFEGFRVSCEECYFHLNLVANGDKI
jgi:hypothetical protein